MIVSSTGDRAGEVARLATATADEVTRLPSEDGKALIVRVGNQDAEQLVARLRGISGTTVTAFPHEAMVLRHDDVDAGLQLRETQPRAAFEVFLRGMKAVGSWPGFLAYSVVAGVLAWVALWQSSVFLLVGAVLVAPYPSAALNVAVATACGDRRLLLRTSARYVAALVVGALAALLMSLAVGMDLPTDLMRAVSYVSYTAVLLPLAAGVAGGLHLAQSEESNLISAVAAGVLVTAALVPPVGVVGMAAAIGDWDAVRRASFLLALQVVGINVMAPLVLWAYRVRPGFAWFERGSRTAAAVAFTVSVVGLGGLMAWQLGAPPALARPTVARDVQTLIVDALEGDPAVVYVGSDVGFAVARVGEPDLLIGTVFVRPRAGSAASPPSSSTIRQQLQRQIDEHGYDLVPLIDVTVLARSSR